MRARPVGPPRQRAAPRSRSRPPSRSPVRAPRTRIVQLIPDLETGGAERMMLNLATGLDRDRYDVTVLSFFDPSGSPIEEALASRGIEVVSLGKKLGFDPTTLLRVAAALRRLAPDVVHTHRPVLPYALPSILGRLRGRVVHTVHSVAQKEVEGRLRRSSHWLAFRAGVAPVAICEFVARSIVDVYGITPRARISNGIPVRDFAASPGRRARWRAANGIPKDAVVLASVARLAPPKNPGALLEAFEALRDHGDAVLLLVGDGPLRAELEERTRALGLAGRVRMMGTRSDVPEVLAACDVFVLPSLYEGSPLSVMEAMAAGRPVVATSVGGVPELVRSGENGLLVPPADVGALTRALRRLVGDAQLRLTLGGAALRTAADAFDVSRMVAAYDRLYQEILAARGAPSPGRSRGPASA